MKKFEITEEQVNQLASFLVKIPFEQVEAQVVTLREVVQHEIVEPKKEKKK